MRSRYRGSLLIETLAGVALSIFAIALAIPILRWSSLGMHRDEAGAVSTAIFDHAVDALRKDVWQARELKQPSPDRLVLTGAAGHILWNIDAAGILHRRDAAGAEQKWTSPAPGVRWAIDGATLIVTLPASPRHPAETLGMVNPASLYATRLSFAEVRGASMSRSRRPHIRRGLATMFAVVLIGLVATALTAAAVLLQNDVRRARTLQSDAQPRQLLLAGVADAIYDSPNWGEAVDVREWGLALPEYLRGQNANLTFKASRTPAGMANVHITATLANRQAEEDLQFRRAGDHWELADTQLGPVSTITAGSHSK